MPKANDLSGMQFGRWSVLRRSTYQPERYDVYWDCICECGKEKQVSERSLIRGRSKSCGCSRKGAFKPKTSRTDKDKKMIGKRFGRWTVLERAEDYVTNNGCRYDQWKCICDCGTTKVVNGSNLIAGKTLSCGCLKRELAKKRTREKAEAHYKSLSNPPSLDEMLRVILGDEYVNTKSEYRLEVALRSMFYNYWFKLVRDEQTAIRRHKSKHPTCEMCGKKCDTVVHHIRPVSEYGGNEAENLMWLCTDCHKQIERKKAGKK